ncbi:syncoilin-like [Salvelinus namaycush]|uniref:Syncoilin-like n=1 Tax=Salvelinus namaycush TaxID=8040 RepID=A0A8U0PQ13_SALNM|nr:syncoilin-like [Salvelinus namaycush]
MEKRRDELMGELQALREEKTGTEEGREGGQAAQLRQVLNIGADGRREARMREWQSLRAERSVEERRLSSVRLERQGLQEEMRRLKRRLFSVARECAHNQVILVTQQREVAQLNKEQMELDTLIIQLTEEVSQLRSTHQTQLSTFQSQLQTPRQTPIPIEELTQSKRTACGDIQQYLQGGLKALEERYEPMLLALLKRKERTSEAQVKARQQAQELRSRRGPMREEGQRLGLQRACLEERLILMETHRREDVERYRETVDRLEDTNREQKTKLQIQKRETKEMEELRDSLTKELYLYRGIVEDNNKNDVTRVQEKTTGSNRSLAV